VSHEPSSPAGATDAHQVAGAPLPLITDEMMRGRLSQAQAYTAVLLRATSKLVRPDVDAIIWEHGRRNMALAEHGVLAIVLPVGDDTELAGLAVFDCDVAQATEIMTHDPGVQAGIFTFETHPVRGFPGATLPARP